MSEACTYYGWTVDHVLEMPIRRLFAMLDAGRAIKTREYITQCDIAAIPMFDVKYLTAIRENFVRSLGPKKVITPEQIEGLDEKPLAGSDAKNALIGLFRGA